MRLEVDEWIGAQPVYTEAGVFLHPLLLDEAAAAQHPQVPADCGSAHLCGGGELTGRAWALPEQIHDPPPGGLGQGYEGGVDIVHY